MTWATPWKNSSSPATSSYIADEAFFTGTAAELTPIREVDNRVIGAGHAGPVTKHLQKEFFRVVKGGTPPYADWLSHYTF